MTERYDAAIREHYKQVAAEDGLSPRSTMMDDITRSSETAAILSFVGHISRKRKNRRLRIVDVGCGNGYTLECLLKEFPGHDYSGLEYTPELLEIAKKRMKGTKVSLSGGDIRVANCLPKSHFDIILCQRVLINLLSPEHQSKALDNLVHAAKAGGQLLFFESFKAPLESLNKARAEFGLPAIPEAHHNLYLPEDFFERSTLSAYRDRGWLTSPNFLSTHYFVTRVLHSVLLGKNPFVRNSEFVKFFSAALPPDVGDYSPIRAIALTKRKRSTNTNKTKIAK